jgi:hypothetical protein
MEGRLAVMESHLAPTTAKNDLLSAPKRQMIGRLAYRNTLKWLTDTWK